MNIKKILAIVFSVAISLLFGAIDTGDCLDKAVQLDKDGRVDEAIRILACVVPQDEQDTALQDKNVAAAALAMAKLYLKKLYSGGEEGKAALSEKFVANLVKASACDDLEIRMNVQEVIDAFGREDYEAAVEELKRKKRVAEESIRLEVDKKRAMLDREREDFEKEMAREEEILIGKDNALKEREDIMTRDKTALAESKAKLSREWEEFENAQTESRQTFENREARLKSREEELEKKEQNVNQMAESMRVRDGELQELRSLLAEKERELTSYEERAEVQEYYWKPPLGMLRGLATVAMSPLNGLRAPFQAHQFNGDRDNLLSHVVIGSFYAAGDGIVFLHDVCAGTADLLTFGWFGNEWYTNGRTPWFWQRNNASIGIRK